jgi:hypothetical protein
MYSASPNFGEGEVDGGGYLWRWFMEVVVVYMLGVELYLKMEFGPWESTNTSRQFPEFINCNLPA